ncbi:MAG TPA: ABC transporter permease [Terriglobales bacterium]|nr:ABC transporter permease [Terriglobales bacterium]
MDSVFQDVRYAVRTLIRKPSFTLVAIITLALGIGANTAMFSVIEAVILRSLPYKDPKHLVVFTDSQDPLRGGFLFKDFEQFRRRSHSFDGLAIYYKDRGVSRVTLSGPVEPEQVQGAFVSSSFFPIMGVAPALGRVFNATEELHHERVVLLSNGLWLRRFAGAGDVLGRTLRIDDQLFQIIGVMPSTFQFPSRDQQFWAPLTTNRLWNDPDLNKVDPHHDRSFYERWQVIGRLKDEVSISQAQEEVGTIFHQIEKDDPDQFRAPRLNLVPLRVELSSNTRRGLFVLFAAVCFVLLIACSNVANLVLARGAGREREMAIRSALGAHRRRLVRQLFTESLLLAVVAAALGLIGAYFALQLLIKLGPPEIPRLEQTGIDVDVLMFTLGVSFLAAILFGIFPALGISRQRSAELLTTGRAVISDPGWRRGRNLLVVVEFALAVMLLTGAGLLLRSYAALSSVDLGFQPEHVLTLRVTMPGLPEAKRAAFYEAMLARVRAIPGVQFAGAIDDLFELGPPDKRGLRAIEGRAVDRPDEWTALNWKQVSGDYIRAMGTMLLKGRLFSDADGPDSPLVAIIDESMARRYWPNEDPIGAHIKGGDQRGHNDDWVTVIGVVRDMRRGGMERQPTGHVFTWYKQNLMYGVPQSVWPGDLVVRTTADPRALAGSLRTAIRNLNDRVILSPVATLEDQLSDQLAPRRFQTSLLGIFSLLGLILAAIGIYGLMHFSVAQRTHDIGVRMALGARHSDVLKMVLMEGSQLAVIGIVAGLGAAAAVTRVLQSMLFGVKPGDPFTFAAVSIVLAAVALLACFIPAQRATKVDPVIALRYE